MEYFFLLKLTFNQKEGLFLTLKCEPQLPETTGTRYPLSQVYQIASGTYCSRELGVHANQII